MKRMLLVVACACHGGAGSRGKPSEGPARTATVHRGELNDRVVLTGELKAATSVELVVPHTDSWEIPLRWMVDDGTPVKAGDRVLEFDNSAYLKNQETLHIQVLQTTMALRLADDVSRMDTADKDVALRESLVAQTKAKLKADLPADLLAGRTAQEYQLTRKHADVDVAKAEKDLTAQRSEASIEQRIKQIELEKAQRALAAGDRAIKELALTAPRDGTVVIGEHPWEGRKFQIGDIVQPGMTIMTLPNSSDQMEVRADLNGVDDGRVAIGMAGTCTLDAYPDKPLHCSVKDLTPVARPKGRKSLRRTFAITLSLADPDQARMRPGMSVKIELKHLPLKDTLVVPRGAVMFDDKVTRVRLAAGELREVTLGPCDAQACAIERGLSDGETVSIGGAP
jgi:multidrug efflux pump subunit AcrA (membrane-fusion protein)